MNLLATKIIKAITALIAVITLCTSCSDDIDNGQNPQTRTPLQIGKILLEGHTGTRADTYNFVWEPTDYIRILPINEYARYGNGNWSFRTTQYLEDYLDTDFFDVSYDNTNPLDPSVPRAEYADQSTQQKYHAIHRLKGQLKLDGLTLTNAGLEPMKHLNVDVVIKLNLSQDWPFDDIFPPDPDRLRIVTTEPREIKTWFTYLQLASNDKPAQLTFRAQVSPTALPADGQVLFRFRHNADTWVTGTYTLPPGDVVTAGTRLIVTADVDYDGELKIQQVTVKEITDVEYETVTPEMEYKISTAADLVALAEYSRGKSLEGWTITLEDDIDLKGMAIPIISGNSWFQGTFDGKGHTINCNGSTSGQLFIGIGRNGTVRNLVIENFNGADYNPPLASANNGRIEGVQVRNISLFIDWMTSGFLVVNNSGTIYCCSAENCQSNKFTSMVDVNFDTLTGCYIAESKDGANYAYLVGTNWDYGTITHSYWQSESGRPASAAQTNYGDPITECYPLEDPADFNTAATVDHMNAGINALPFTPAVKWAVNPGGTYPIVVPNP